MIFIFFSLSPHASSWELLVDLWLRSSRDCLLIVAENASSSDNIRFSRNSSHLCFTSLLSIFDIMHNICHSSLSWWSCQQTHQRLRICSVVIILLPHWRSLISLYHCDVPKIFETCYTENRNIHDHDTRQINYIHIAMLIQTDAICLCGFKEAKSGILL